MQVLKGVVNIPVLCVIEEKIKVFDLIKNILTSNNSEKNIFLCGSPDLGNLPNIYPEIDLAVIGDCNTHVKMTCPDNIKSVLLNIDNSKNIKLNKNTQSITCGLKEKDTAIFSSINIEEGSVILDLQRSIKNINGETLEPFEKQINVPDFAAGVKTEDLILALTALAFCGRI